MTKTVLALVAVVLLGGMALPLFQTVRESSCARIESRMVGNHPPSIVVYRHHPGLIHDCANRNHDHDLILDVYETSAEGSIRIQGGLGRGYEYELPVECVDSWVDGMTELLSSGKLKHYTQFGFDQHGIGLESPGNLNRP